MRASRVALPAAVVAAAVRSTLAVAAAPGPRRRILGATLVDSAGTGLYLTIVSFFLLRAMGASTRELGLALSVAGFAAFVGTIPAGRLADRWGSRRVLLILFGWRAVAYALLAVCGSFPAALAALAIAGLADRAAAPVMQNLIIESDHGSEEPVTSLAAAQSVKNVGFSLGGLLGAAALSVNSGMAFRLSVAANALSFVVAGLLVLSLPGVASRGRAVSRRVRLMRDRRFILLSVTNGLVTMHAWVLAVGIPIWLYEYTSVSRWVVSLLLVTNTVLAVMFQVPASRGADQPQVAWRRLHHACLVLAATTVLIPVTASIPPWAAGCCFFLLIGMLTFGELLHSAGSWGLSVAWSPRDQRGQYLAFFSLGFAVQSVVAPIAVTQAVAFGPMGFIALSAVFLTARVVLGQVGVPADSGAPAVVVGELQGSVR
jgi:MFS family permease